MRDGAAEAVSEEVVLVGGRRGLRKTRRFFPVSAFPFFLPFPEVPGTRGESFGRGGCVGQARCQAPEGALGGGGGSIPLSVYSHS